MVDSHSHTASGLGPIAHEITERIAVGDECAFASFYEAWFASTLALARAVSRRDEPWCLDVVQDVMLTVARKMPKLASQEALRAWMTRTVVNAVTDRSRSEQRRRRREEAVAAAANEVGDPFGELCDQERLTWLTASVAALPQADQALLEARYGQASNVTAAADAYGLNADQAYGRLRRALNKLRQQASKWRSSE